MSVIILTALILIAVEKQNWRKSLIFGGWALVIPSMCKDNLQDRTIVDITCSQWQSVKSHFDYKWRLFSAYWLTFISINFQKTKHCELIRLQPDNEKRKVLHRPVIGGNAIQCCNVLIDSNPFSHLWSLCYVNFDLSGDVICVLISKIDFRMKSVLNLFEVVLYGFYQALLIQWSTGDKHFFFLFFNMEIVIGQNAIEKFGFKKLSQEFEINDHFYKTI